MPITLTEYNRLFDYQNGSHEWVWNKIYNAIVLVLALNLSICWIPAPAVFIYSQEKMICESQHLATLYSPAY